MMNANTSARRSALIFRCVDVVAFRVFVLLARRNHACRQHHPLERLDRHRREFEVAEPVPAGNRQRRPSELVPAVPDVDARALVREELDRARKVLVRRAVVARLGDFAGVCGVDEGRAWACGIA